MLDAIDIDLGDDVDEKNVTGDLHQVRFMLYNQKKGNTTPLFPYNSQNTDKNAC